MIIVQSPLRVSLFGGGTDFPDFYLKEGGEVLSTTIDKYIFVTAKRRFDQKLRVGYTKTELVDSLDGIEHELIREAFRMTGIQAGVEITTMGDIPSTGSGLGSSSTVSVGSLLALYELQGLKVLPDRLAKEACRIEIDILHKPIGIQDQYAAAFGGMSHMEFTQQGEVILNPVRLSAETVRNLNENLLLFYTDMTRQSATILEEQKGNIGDRTSILREIKGLVSLAKKELEVGNLDDIGHMLHYTWSLKKRLASKISNPDIDAMYEAGRNAGALGGKIIGAGGGGFLLLYCPIEHRDSVRAALSGLREQPFQLEPDGAKVILNYPRSVTLNDIALHSRRDTISVNIPSLREDKNTSEPVSSDYILNRFEHNWTDPVPQNLTPSLKAYASDVKGLLDRLPLDEISDVIRILQAARWEKRKVFIMGNGGSGATATHFVCDLAKNTRSKETPDFRVIGLNDNMALLSAYANDDGYSMVFRSQLASQVDPGDIVIAISASGNSENTLEAVRAAKDLGAVTIGFTGFDGGELGRLVDKEIHIKSDCIENVEDLHLLLEHMIVHTIKNSKWRPLHEEGVPAREDVAGKDVIVNAMAPEQVSLEAQAFPAHIRLSHAETLYAFSRLITDPRRSENWVRRLLLDAVRRFAATSGSLLLFNDGVPAGEVIHYNGELVMRFDDQHTDVAERGLFAWVRENRMPALITNTRNDPRWLKREWDGKEGDSRSAMAVPLFHHGQVIGALTLVRPYGFTFDEQEFVLFSALSMCFSMNSQKIKEDLISQN